MTIMADQQATLVEYYIDEYLHNHGLSWQQLKALPGAEAKHIMVEASNYASARLAEIQARAHAVEDLHGLTQLS